MGSTVDGMFDKDSITIPSDVAMVARQLRERCPNEQGGVCAPDADAWSVACSLCSASSEIERLDSSSQAWEGAARALLAYCDAFVHADALTAVFDA